jgi:hypothetical protein
MDRYENKCIITGSTNSIVLEACHIISYSDCISNEDINNKKFDVNNGLLMKIDYHKMFDNFQFSINPTTLRIEILDKNTDGCDDIENIQIKNLNKKTLENLKYHYKIFCDKRHDNVEKYNIIKSKKKSNKDSLIDDLKLDEKEKNIIDKIAVKSKKIDSNKKFKTVRREILQLDIFHLLMP